MKFVSSIWLRLFLGANISTAVLVGANYIHRDLTSKAAISERAKGLQQIAKHVRADHCWKDESPNPFKLGDIIEPPGSLMGRIPTGCIYAPKPQQFLQVGYLNGELQIIHVFSRREVRNQLGAK